MTRATFFKLRTNELEHKRANFIKTLARAACAPFVLPRAFKRGDGHTLRVHNSEKLSSLQLDLKCFDPK